MKIIGLIMRGHIPSDMWIYLEIIDDQRSPWRSLCGHSSRYGRSLRSYDLTATMMVQVIEDNVERRGHFCGAYLTYL